MLTGVFERIEQANVALPALQAKPARNAHQGAAGQRVLGKVNLLTKRKSGVEVVHRDGSAGKRLDQCNLDRAELIVASHVRLDVGNKPIEYLRGVRANALRST
jgi:hypothetical protein